MTDEEYWAAVMARNIWHFVPCRRCGEDDHCGCYHVACCYCGSKAHVDAAADHGYIEPLQPGDTVHPSPVFPDD